MTGRKARVIAFYLPQYHPVRENNEWWGSGFTDWVNVARARPRFRGHRQPHVPADLGFYDLRLSEVRSAQAEMAAAHGIDGFCYYHYWFTGRILLGRPFEEVLASGVPAFPFCLCWANENWTRAWDGLERQVLVRQEYSAEDAVAHMRWLLRAFRDSRYLRVAGRPLLLVYRPDQVPRGFSLIAMWHAEAASAGEEAPYICAVRNGFVAMDDEDLLSQGYDAIVDFQPNRRDFPLPTAPAQWLLAGARRFLPSGLYQAMKLRGSATKRVDYAAMVEAILGKSWPTAYRKLPCVFPSWDNTPRRNTPTVIQNEDPAVYRHWLRSELDRVGAYPAEEQMVFVNAWNEWAEGCHLEPDLELGHAFLDATKAARGG